MANQDKFSIKETLFQGRHLHLVRAGSWEYAERPGVTGIVGILAVTEERKLLLIEQFRPPVGRRVIELPAGLAGDLPQYQIESLATAAQRELLEETGYQAREMEYLVEGPPSAGITSEVLTLFRAHGLSKVNEGGGDATERIQVHEVPLAEVESWLKKRIAEGVMVDFKVYAGLYFAR